MLSLIFRLARLFSTAKTAAERQAMIPSKADKEQIRALLVQLDERRVFHAPFHDEVVGACLYSLDEVRKSAYDALGKLSNEPAKAVVGAVLDETRVFVEKWKASSLYPVVRRSIQADEEDSELREFFQALGALRERVALCRQALDELLADSLYTRLLPPPQTE